MISYKDKTFCPFHETCKDGKTCPDALTPKVKADALVWWANWEIYRPVPISAHMNNPEFWANWELYRPVPISAYMNKPECWKGRL